MRFIQHQSADHGLKIDQIMQPLCKDHQVLVKVAGFGINRADLLQRYGKYPPPPNESHVLGLEVSGEVVERGREVSQWREGDRVCGLVAGGGYAEYVAVDALHLMSVPQGMPLRDAAGLPEIFLTAYQALFLLGRLQAEQSLLFHAGASGVGSAAIQLARVKGARVAVTASSDEKLAFCQALGAELLINYKSQSFVELINQKWRGVDLIVDVVAADYVNANLKSLNMDGRIVQLAILGGRYVQNLDMAAMLQKRASLIASTLRNRSDSYKASLTRKFTEEYLPAFDSGTLRVCVDTCYPADQIHLAHQRLETNQSMGKLIGYWD
ncbi:NAD(P)H-quinone oxidoreductase [Bowmanella dokdonensis]|uniref:NAD(P)H-quinone oxidoreductase n=1 Tax=Bowmanella dokdonensis TaxID=751969 RepID=A0A939DLD6_9ALTE|nr:NAD(P)H-quinone oxidoreductase [Bowmanella dokdonensis]MBN7824427.1 NAD(P)H-quinone oxidoreductase [Bowmanella dokdonensis]